MPKPGAPKDLFKHLPTRAVVAILALFLACDLWAAAPAPDEQTPPTAQKEAKKPIPAPLEADREKQLAARGERLALNNCIDCHTFDEGGPNRSGPNLFGVFGAKHASKKDFKYSKALSAMKNKVWTEKALKDWIYSPQEYAPGTLMMRGQIQDDDQNAALVAFLKSLK